MNFLLFFLEGVAASLIIRGGYTTKDHLVLIIRGGDTTKDHLVLNQVTNGLNRIRVFLVKINKVIFSNHEICVLTVNISVDVGTDD